MTYDISPHRLDVPLSEVEVEQLLASGGRAFKDTRRLMHLLHRVHATIQTHREQRQGLHQEIARLRMQQDKVGVPTTLSPKDAVKYLAPEAIAELAGGYLRTQIEHTVRKTAEAEQARARYTASLSGLQLAIATVIASGDLPEAASAKLKAALREGQRMLATPDANGLLPSGEPALPVSEEAPPPPPPAPPVTGVLSELFS